MCRFRLIFTTLLCTYTLAHIWLHASYDCLQTYDCTQPYDCTYDTWHMKYSYMYGILPQITRMITHIGTLSYGLTQRSYMYVQHMIIYTRIWFTCVWLCARIRIWCTYNIRCTSHEQNPSRHLWKFSRDIVFKTPLKTPFQDTSVLKRRLEKKVRCLGEPSWKFSRRFTKTVHQDAFSRHLSRRLFKTPMSLEN